MALLANGSLASVLVTVGYLARRDALGIYFHPVVTPQPRESAWADSQITAASGDVTAQAKEIRRVLSKGWPTIRRGKNRRLLWQVDIISGGLGPKEGEGC